MNDLQPSPEQGLGGFMAALRAMNRGYNGITQESTGVHVFGAYGMILENWDEWAAEAGYAGADPADPSAQDAVAGYWASNFHSRYGNWDLVSAAWFAGQDQADQAMQSGYDLFKNERIRKFQEQMAKAQEQLLDTPVPSAAQKWVNESVRGQWLHPIAGTSEYSGGSWMPDSVNHRGRNHAAIDVYAGQGTPIVAPVSGHVVKAGWNDLGGHTITVKGDDGITYYFAHMDSEAVPEAGTKVGAGTHLGFVGNSGSAKSTSPHLHLSMRRGDTKINPKSFLDGSRNAKGYFAASAGQAVEGMESKPSEHLDAMLGTMSDRIAGGDRMDPREIGVRAVDQLRETGEAVMA